LAEDQSLRIQKNITEPDSFARHAQVFHSLEVCVLIPTFNNADTLGRVISDVSAYTKNIIVVNDGSSDNTIDIIRSFPFLKSISYESNRGKGWALRQGFKLAISLGYHFAISIDSDGQHFASDLPAFLEKLESAGTSLIVGARNMRQESVPAKSNFGHRFSNFWFWFETGIKLPDTQSGYRLYPLIPLEQIRFFTKKYEFEIEVMVRAAWKEIPIYSVPIGVYYPPKAERVTHFRPFRDFTRISILNTFLVFLTIFYIWPRNFFRKYFLNKNGQEIIHDLLLNPSHSDTILALSIGFGVFMGIIPIWGFQLILAIFLAILFKLNKPLVILAANISIPPMIPVILFGSYKLGAYWMPAGHVNIPFGWDLKLENMQYNLQQYIYGSITLAVLAGAFFSLTSFILFKLFRRKASPAI
jgi:glycosyltransferase involved in cell wall biosynthesis